MNNSFNRYCVNNRMINFSDLSANFSWSNNWSIINSLSWSLYESNLSLLVFNNWLDYRLVNNSLTWNRNSLGSNSVLNNSLLDNWSMINHLILSSSNLNIYFFLLNNWLNNFLSVDLCSWYINNFLRNRNFSSNRKYLSLMSSNLRSALSNLNVFLSNQ